MERAIPRFYHEEPKVDQWREYERMKEDPPKTVPDFMREAADIYEERSKLYGDNYKRFGPIMMLLFPDGLRLEHPNDFTKFGLFVQIVSKVTRIAENFKSGCHPDSMDDTAVYTMMLREVCAELHKDTILETF